MRNSLIRALSGTIFVVVVLTSIWLGSIAMIVLFALFVFLGLREFYAIFRDEKIRIRSTIVAGMVVYGLLVAQRFSFFDSRLAALSLFAIAWLMIEILYLKHSRPFQALSIQFFGIFYVVVPFALINLSDGYLLPSDDWKLPFSMSFFILIWTNDTMAYVVGKFLGKTHLMPNVSPKKTWEGFIGGLLFTLLAAFLLAKNTGGASEAHWIAVGCITSIFGTLGDLIQSKLKRSYAIKDTGNILPGHGGVLDRFDGFIFALPPAILYLLIAVQ